MSDNGGAAFPTFKSRAQGYIDTDHPGMALRDYFAAQALGALGTHPAVAQRGIDWIAQHAYMVADAMLKERAK